MPPKRKFNSRFPSARIKKIMQSDDDIGKVSAPVPLVVSRAVEVFLESLLSKAQEQLEKSRTASRTLSPAHLKRCIETEPKFDFLRALVQHVPDIRPTTPEITSHAQSLVMNNSHSDPSMQPGTASASLSGPLDPSEKPKRKRGRPPGSGKKAGDGTPIKKAKPQFINPDGTPYKPKRGRKPKAWKEAIARGENPLLLGQCPLVADNQQVPVIPQITQPPLLDPAYQGDPCASSSNQIREEPVTPLEPPVPVPVPVPTNSNSNSLEPPETAPLVPKPPSPPPIHINNLSYNMSSIINKDQSEDDDYDS